ncbi:MAG: UDP-N-acetylglucosamine 1-carboxyvinyltransferase [Clostridia bacterium]|nr:UDP-N-acetylglucosamine 1-carboxyvinyltransferase [Clostridia bacterium]
MSEKFIINGGKKLYGSIRIDSSKNAILPILAGCILCEDVVVLHDCPNFNDINAMLEVLRILGAKINKVDRDIYIDCKNIEFHYIPSELTKIIRSSIFVLGALLGRLGKAKIAYPGGCDIGLRPIDMHLKGLKELGIDVDEKHGYIYCDAKNFTPSTITLDYPSVGATENLIMVSVLSKGTTRILHPAREPEIVDLQQFINAMGGDVSGAGTDEIVINGVAKLRGTHYTPMPDRIIAGTVMVACAMAGGEVLLEHCEPKHFLSIIDKLSKSSCKIVAFNDKIYIHSDTALHSFGGIETGPYPGFPTDMQTQMLTMATICEGNTKICENVFENRFKIVPELCKMGADISVVGKTCWIKGVKSLYGATVYAQDLRGGASLVLAGLSAKGYTTVYDVGHIDRGYDKLDLMLSSLGADIRRQKVEV